MRLSWNEIRARAAAFSAEWKHETYERGEAQTFYNEFFDIFGIRRRRVAAFEEPVRKLGDKRGFIDLFWKGLLIVEQKSAGQNLIRAREQAFDYFPGIKEADLPRYVLVSDFQNFELLDLETEECSTFALEDLPRNIEKFGFILGYEKRTFHEQDPVNIDAAELMGALHDTLKASGYTDHDLERFLVRILFCLFADDTGIFEPRDLFTDLITTRTREDGTDTGLWLAKLFEVLNTPENQREAALDEDLARFPYVNGDLFAETLRIPSFNKKMRQVLIDACEFYWERISPAIFGSLFQFVMNAKRRRAEGAHYTNETCILKLIEPLFLDNLRAELAHIKDLKRDRSRRLELLHDKISAMRFLDPACGCGNFLVIAYRELRLLELEILHALFDHKKEDRLIDFDPVANAKINVDQFSGIEFSEFPARISEVALWMMDHIMNVRLSLEFHQNYARIPLKRSPRIIHRDALDCDWEEALPARDCSFVLGNPPFVGSKYQSDSQRKQVRRIANLGGSGGTLDYVAAWFIKAGEYINKGKARIGFVATNSITQGEQVAQLWPLLFNRFGLEISFAHRTFAWESEARGKAHVHVVILGLTKQDDEPEEKRLFSYDDLNSDPIESRHKSLSPYLIDASRLTNRHIVVRESSKPLSGAPKMIIGSKPIDGGYFIFDSDADKDKFVALEPGSIQYIRPYLGADEYINGQRRWILSLQKIDPPALRKLPSVVKRVRCVGEYRRGELPPRKDPDGENNVPGISARALAETPTSWHVTVIPEAPFLCVPEVSSERREYVPIGWLEPPIIPSNKMRLIYSADLWHFAVLTSKMHMAWTKYVGGRLESRYQYSIGINYNQFPWPSADDALKNKIRPLAESIIETRNKYSGSTLADLYDSTFMPPDLRKAHNRLDAAIDKAYKKEGFSDDKSRVEHLLAIYEQRHAPLLTSPIRRRSRKKGS